MACRGKYAEIYGERLDLVRLLANPSAPGRDHVVFATDEILPAAMNYAPRPTHVLAVRTREVKLVTYSDGRPARRGSFQASLKVEFYDYATATGRAETAAIPTTPGSSRCSTSCSTNTCPADGAAAAALAATDVSQRPGQLSGFKAATDAYSYKASGPSRSSGRCWATAAARSERAVRVRWSDRCWQRSRSL